MSTTFPRTKRSRHGYNVEQVEDFLEDARRAYQAESGQPTVVTAGSIRHTAFSLQKGGYSTAHVDAALERLEDAFSGRERERRLSDQGDHAWYANARSTAQVVLDRLARKPGEKFTRVGVFSSGYDPTEVDRFSKRLTDFFQDGRPMGVDEVRTVAFRPKRGGYRESQVDALLDTVVDVMLAVR